MITSLSQISTPSSSTSSFEEAKCTSQSKLAEEQSILYEVSLAQAEFDDDLEEDSERSKRSFSDVKDEDFQTNNLNRVTKLKQACCYQNDSKSKESLRNDLASRADDNLTIEAKEYWATIDFYNNSKIAFNKRVKSVKLKREKINNEINEQNERQVNEQKLMRNRHNESFSNQDLCNCVKCSIIIHEALIQGLQNVQEILCKKCHSKLDTCKCSQNRIKKETNGINKKLWTKESNNFEQKLLNIKNELVNLSETSLDVFQLLLQLSDTVLDLNNQLSSSTNVNQLFLSNSNLNQNAMTTYENKPYQNSTCRNCEKSESWQDTKSPIKIDNFQQKSETSAINKELNNSITTIINKINNRSNYHKIENLKKAFSSKSRSNSPISIANHSNKLIETVYDKTSVTQFVESLLNSKSGEDLSRASSGFYSATSLLTMINQEEVTNIPSLSDTSQSFSIKQTPNIKLSSITNNIICRQIKNPSTSNIDLSETKSFRHSTLSTCSSNTDSSIDQSKFMIIQSPKSVNQKEVNQSNSTVAVLAANFRKNSTSNNTLSSNSSRTSPVPNLIASTTRKPSFKFENNTILNKVQNMNVKTKYLSPQNLNDICELNSVDKRCSLNQENEYDDSERCSVRRQQSIKYKNLVQTPVRSESSLDSGINLSSENEESRIISTIK